MDKVQVKCIICGKEEFMSPVHSKKYKTCSHKCMAEYYRTKLKGENNPNWKGGICQQPRIKKRKDRIEKICPKCNKVFFVPPCRIKQTLCSRNCFPAISNKIIIKRQYKITRRCPVCLTEFKTYKSRIKKYCSRKCYGKDQSLRQLGEKSHFWKGGITDWKMQIRTHKLYREWRDSIFKRDDYTCQSCLKTSKELSRGKLTAHHIVPFKDDATLILKKSNGITLCWQCHRDFHRLVRSGELPKKESLLEEKTRDYFKNEPGVCMFKIHGHEFQAAGLPDFMGSVSGVFTGIELKIFPNFVTPLQKYQLKRIERAGGQCFVCYSLDEVKRVVICIKESKQEKP